ncbi:fasciclin domain-containing protein [Pontibacter sp. Tf4]|uniref:fasciclin domain-containing protein n=1 Tax=Pontibacter sp. Tf4 TaxID=2761620 RepID=UPI00162512E5|nr:fasciclin domain-containing protein [Pontibacter sp. Tf4]MBB6610996.1 fasciclin domain-containing protein [Pontibacter sp. Tf4]
MKTCLKHYLLSLPVCFALLTGCGPDKYQEKNTRQEGAEQQDTNASAASRLAQTDQVNIASAAGNGEVPSSLTIPQNAQSKAELSTFILVLKKAGLLRTLNNTGPYTVFAPSNKAFEALPGNTLKDLTKPGNRQQLEALLNNHIVAGKLDATALQDGSRIKTLANGELEVSKRQENVTINGAEVIISDVESSNGVMHIVDKVLLPKEQHL